MKKIITFIKNYKVYILITIGVLIMATVLTKCKKNINDVVYSGYVTTDSLNLVTSKLLKSIDSLELIILKENESIKNINYKTIYIKNKSNDYIRKVVESDSTGGDIIFFRKKFGTN
jgi:hypothetical protein